MRSCENCIVHYSCQVIKEVNGYLIIYDFGLCFLLSSLIIWEKIKMHLYKKVHSHLEVKQTSESYVQCIKIMFCLICYESIHFTRTDTMEEGSDSVSLCLICGDKASNYR